MCVAFDLVYRGSAIRFVLTSSVLASQEGCCSYGGLGASSRKVALELNPEQSHVHLFVQVSHTESRTQASSQKLSRKHVLGVWEGRKGAPAHGAQRM